MSKIISFFLLFGMAFSTAFSQRENQRKPANFELGISSKLNQVEFVEGVAPAEFQMNNYTLGLNLSGSIIFPIHSNFDLMTGLTYNIDRYKSSLRLDYKVDQPGYYGIWRLQATEYLTPHLGLIYHLPGESNPLSFAVLGRYKWSNAPFLSRFTEDHFVDGFDKPVIIKREARTQPLNHSKVGFQMQMRYQYLRKGKLNSSIALVYQYAHATSRVEELISLNDRDFHFTYVKKASFWGMSLFFGY